MAYCVPIKDLKDTAAFSRLVKKTEHPIFITKNGREEFVVMSTEVYRQETGQAIDQATKGHASKPKSTQAKPKKAKEEETSKVASAVEAKEAKAEVAKEEPVNVEEVADVAAEEEKSVNIDDVAKMKEALAFLEEVKKHFG